MQRRVSRREITYLISGLVIGLLVGMVLVGSNEDLRASLFGSAADGSTSRANDFRDYAYYLVDLPTAQEWLAERYPDSREEIIATLEAIAKLPSSADFHQAFRDAEPEVSALLPRVASALGTSAPDGDPTGELGWATCLGLDDNPYWSQPTLYFYVTISANQVDQLDVPDSWERLEKPKANALFWQLLACYPLPEPELAS